MSIGSVGSGLLPPSLALYRNGPAATSAVPPGGPDADAARARASTAAKASPVGGDWGLGAPDNLMAQALWRCTATLSSPGGVPVEVSASHSIPSVARDTVREAADRLQGLFPNHRCEVGSPVRMAD